MFTPLRTTIVVITAVAAIMAGVFAFARPTQARVVLAETAVPEPTPAAEIVEQTADDQESTSTPQDETTGEASEAVPTMEPIAAEDDEVAAPTPEPTPDPTATPAPAPTVAACDEAFMMGRWNHAGVGTTGTAVSLDVDTTGACESVTIGTDGTSPGIEVTRIPFLNWTRIRFDTPEIPMLPAPDLIMAGGDVVKGAVAFNDNFGPGVFITHPSGVEVAAQTSIEGDVVRIDFRESQPGDATVDAAYGGEPYAMPMNGSPEDGLVVLLATELEGSGEIGILGYARAPEATVVVRIWDGVVLVEETALVAEGPAYSYGRFHHTTLLANGTYTVEVGWDSPSGLPEFDVWYSTEATVIGGL